MESLKPTTERLKFTLCGNKTCCPVLTELDNNQFSLTDYYEGSVLLTREELVILKNFLNEKIKE